MANVALVVGVSPANDVRTAGKSRLGGLRVPLVRLVISSCWWWLNYRAGIVVVVVVVVEFQRVD